ncbi:hypothetical protein [Mesorhizobium sp. B1-1-8]|uniref:hypothetical protein n=1 Tax=Mesorhizobium sp. B1-1-8 TaxID=2589976 RepID=UPI00112D2E64|nr:hypothetical protein [Mesorhizobium sp. B1-1-8]UCI05262.1 hypothetical protein FJ974_15480 [Mesorhizobium sp. B1-1-8]
MNLLRIALVCAAMISLAGVPAVRAEDQPAPSKGEKAPEQPPVHCKGQNCLPPAENPVQECKGPDCTPVPAPDQTPPPVIEKVK